MIRLLLGLILITATLEQKLLAEQWDKYQQDPKGFITTCLDVKPEHFWPKMEEIANSVRDNQFTAVPACHDVSKTYGAARIVNWFKSCYNPSTIITTAPSDNLVRNQLWREIHASYSGAKVKLGGKMTSLMWDCKPSKEILEILDPEQRALWEKNFALGFSTSPDTVTEYATKIQGFHNKWLLCVLDEAGGILRAIWKAILEGLIINERCKVLAIGNCTDPTSMFYKVCQPDSGWNVIHISVQDTPNYKLSKEVIPNVAGRSYWNRMKKDYGEHSNTFKVRCKGEFPEFREGTFFGRELAIAKKETKEEQSRVGNYPYETTQPVYSALDIGDMYTAGLFVQFLRGRIRIIDCYWDNQGLGIGNYKKVMDCKEYIWGKEHYAGPDLVTSNAKSAQTGMVMRDTAAQLGLNLIPVFPHTVEEGHQAIRDIFPLIEINKPFCKVFLQATEGYRKKKNEALSTDDQPAYHDTPVPNAWENHMMAALRHLAMAYRYQSFGGRSLGRTRPREDTLYVDSTTADSYNYKKHGFR